MKRHVFSAVLCLIFFFAPGVHAFAADGEALPADQMVVTDEAELSTVLMEQEPDEEAFSPEHADTGEAGPEEAGPEEAAGPEKPSGPDILVNGLSIREQAAACLYGQTTYLSLRALCTAVFPDAQITWTDGGAQVQADGLHITARPGSTYLVANGRYLYVPDGIKLANGVTLAPVRILAKALGASVRWDADTGAIQIAAENGPIEGGDSFYKSDAVYWLSRIINAESGTQSLAGKVAVGTVILNRVKSALFPDTIYNVIFDCRSGSYQFSPARSGSIHRDPNAESVIAAKLCLDGAREAGNSLFFNGVGLTCWASRNRSLVTTIDGHSFYE